MSGVSFQLIAFSLVAALLYNLSSSRSWRQPVLLAANLLFLATFCREPRAWVPFASFVSLGYIGVRLLQGKFPGAFWPFLIGTITAFVWLKKYTFVPHGLFLRSPYVVIGLSYIFFRMLHLLIDIRGGVLRERIGLVSYLNYTLNFTSLVSGPIQRYQDFAAAQLGITRPSPDIFVIGGVVQRVIVGVFKVTVLSQLFLVVQEQTIRSLSPGSTLTRNALAAATIGASYPFYLYCNFSGYMDVVIGLARLFELDLPENFNRPFAAQSFIDFWNRWHITLSSWLKAYVYNPLLLALMRRYPRPGVAPLWGVIAYFVTFFLIGIWHGQTSEFVVYGLVLALGVSVNKMFQVVGPRIWGRERNRLLQANAFYNSIARGLTFTWFAFSLIFFWSNWKQIQEMLGKLSPGALVFSWIFIFLGATLILAAYEAIRTWALTVAQEGLPVLSSRYARVVYCTTLAFVSLVVTALANLPAPRIIYRNF